MVTFDRKTYEHDIYEDAAYSSWLKHANEREYFARLLKEKFSEWCQKKRLTIIEVGCGVGSAAKRIFEVLDEKGVDYEYTGFDPYKEQLLRFREQFPKKNIGLIKATLDSFSPRGKKFDVAFVVHSLYYVDNMEAALIKIGSFARKMVIVHHGKKGINLVHEKFSKYVKKGPNIISTYEKVTQALNALKIPYSIEIIETQVNIHPCKDPHNLPGRNMIKFFLERTDLPESTIKEVAQFLKTQPDTMIHEIAFIITS